MCNRLYYKRLPHLRRKSVKLPTYYRLLFKTNESCGDVLYISLVLESEIDLTKVALFKIPWHLSNSLAWKSVKIPTNYSLLFKRFEESDGSILNFLPLLLTRASPIGGMVPPLEGWCLKCLSDFLHVAPKQGQH